MSLQTRKKMTLLSALVLGAFVATGCEWDSEPRDGGQKKAVEFHSISPQPATVDEAPGVELVELHEPGVDEQEPERSDQLMEVAFEHVDEQPTDHLAVARDYLEKHDNAAALVELGKALYDDPQDYTAAVLLGRTALRSKEIDLARKVFVLASLMDPDQADAWIYLGRIAIKEKNLNRAADWARQALSVDSQRAESHNLMGRVWLAKSHWERSIASFKKAVSLSKDNPYYLNNLGLAYLMKKNYNRAVEVLEGVVGNDAATAFMRNNLGLAYEGAGRLQEAISEFKTAIDLSPSYINAQVNLDRLVTLAKRAEEYVEPVPAILVEPDDVAEDLIIVEPEDD